MYKKILLMFFLAILFDSCQNHLDIKNENQKHFINKVGLKEIFTKEFVLDSLSAPKLQYSSVYNDNSGKRYFSFLNKINSSVYFYNYDSLNLVKKLLIIDNSLSRTNNYQAFYIRNFDSIYVYNKANMNIQLINSNGVILKKISLIGNNNIRKIPWFYKFPQYNPQTAKPFIATSKELLFVGQYIMSVPDSLIDRFRYLTHINLLSNKVSFSHLYPKILYGFNYNWDGQVFTEVYVDYVPDINKLIFSFPVSHDLYLSDLNSNNYKRISGGSIAAGTISSLKGKPLGVSNEAIMNHFIKNDEYAAIKYDKYRKVYYRFLRKAIPDATAQTQYQEKKIIVIILDSNFDYLGETNIGKWQNWNIANTFVTKEGLNVEYIPTSIDESKIILKVFTINKN